jgi:DNA helicase IV
LVALSVDLEGLSTVVNEEITAVGTGNLAVVAAASQILEIESALDKSDIAYGRPNRRGLDEQVAVVPVELVKGLEVDAAIVVDPARIVREQEQGVRALYVALTRSTKRLVLVHTERLPEILGY